MSYGLANFEAVDGSPGDDELFASDAGNVLAQKLTLDAGTVARGDLVGVITASGKVIKSLSAASDGSQTPFGVAAHAADASDGDVELEVYVRGNFNSARIGYGTAHTLASVREGLRDKGIYLEVPVLRYPNT